MISDTPEQIYIENYSLERRSRRVRGTASICVALGLVLLGALTYAMADNLIAGRYYLAIIAITLWAIIACLEMMGIRMYWNAVKTHEHYRALRDEARLKL